MCVGVHMPVWHVYTWCVNRWHGKKTTANNCVSLVGEQRPSLCDQPPLPGNTRGHEGPHSWGWGSFKVPVGREKTVTEIPNL